MRNSYSFPLGREDGTLQRPCSGQDGSALVFKRGHLLRAERAGGGQEEEKGLER